MNVSRREFLTKAAGASAACAFGIQKTKAESTAAKPADTMGVLVDIPLCVGCRKCEFACQKADGADVPRIDAFEDKSVFESYRRPSPDSLTVVNRFENPADDSRPIYNKINCLHCLDPACASACLVGALTSQPNGAITYDAGKCMGCRYCMVACPFQIPSYEYDDALTPRVRKCSFCFDRFDDRTEAPACVKICPNDALVFGKRSELLALAHDKIREAPNKYVDHVYGEHEAGGTSWLYLSSVPFEQLQYVTLGTKAPPRLTEAIQHGVFKLFVPPLALYGLLAVIMRMGRHEEPELPSPVVNTVRGADHTLPLPMPGSSSTGKQSTSRAITVEERVHS